jgi:hypothetical protein
MRFVAASGGVSVQTLTNWRDGDPTFGLAIEQARAEALRERWETIKRLGLGTKNSPPNWAAIAWQLERAFPHEFGKPEAQLNLQVNSQQNINTGLVVSAEVAEKLEQRSRKIEAEVDARLAAHRPKGLEEGNGDYPPPGAAERVVEAELVPDIITLPPEPQRTPSWWRQLSRGDGARGITSQAALFVIETVRVQVYGLERAAGMEIEFDDREPKLRDVYSAIADLCGPRGWEVLIELGGES